MVKLTADIEAVSAEVDGEERSILEYSSYIEQIHTEKSTLVRVHAEWKKLGGPEADTAVGKAVEDLSQSANKVINGIRVKMAIVGQGAKPEGGNKPRVDSKVDSERVPGAGLNKSVARVERDVRPKIRIDPVAGTSGTTTVSQNTSIPPAIVSTHPIVSTSGYADKLASAASGGTSTKRGSKAGSTGSAAARLQLKLQEAEAKVDEEFHRELSARSQRQLVRDFKKEQERLADETEDREVAIGKKRAGIKAKQDVIDRFDEENEGSLLSKAVGGADLAPEPPGETEIKTADKVAAFVSELYKMHFNSDSRGGQIEENAGNIPAPKEWNAGYPTVSQYSNISKAGNISAPKEWNAGYPTVSQPSNISNNKKSSIFDILKENSKTLVSTNGAPPALVYGGGISGSAYIHCAGNKPALHLGALSESGANISTAI